MEWVATPSSSVSSQPRDPTHVACIGRQSLYHWATWEVQIIVYFLKARRLSGIIQMNTVSSQEPLGMKSFLQPE